MADIAICKCLEVSFSSVENNWFSWLDHPIIVRGAQGINLCSQGNHLYFGRILEFGVCFALLRGHSIFSKSFRGIPDSFGRLLFVIPRGLHSRAILFVLSSVLLHQGHSNRSTPPPPPPPTTTTTTTRYISLWFWLPLGPLYHLWYQVLGRVVCL